LLAAPGAQPPCSSHTACRLGQWYYHGEGKALFSRLPGYRELEAPHAAVHQFGVDAVNRFCQGDMAGALDAVMQMERRSAEVLQFLENMACAAAEV